MSHPTNDVVDSDDSSFKRVSLSANQIRNIISGEYVHEDSETFGLDQYSDQPDPTCTAYSEGWSDLLNGRVDEIEFDDCIVEQAVSTHEVDDTDNDPVGVPDWKETPDGSTDDKEDITITDTGTSDIDWDEMTTVPDSERDVIRMEQTVDVSGMDAEDREAIGELADLYEDCFKTVTEKNRDYSWSFLRTGQKLADTPGVPFDDPVRAQVFGLITRLGDKHERLIENVYGDGDAAVSDSPATTAAECANYYMFLSFVLANPELAGSFLETAPNSGDN